MPLNRAESRSLTGHPAMNGRARDYQFVALFRRVKLWLWPCLSLVDRKATVDYTGRVQLSEKCHRKIDLLLS